MISLNDYGFTDFFQNQITDRETEMGLIPARVISIQKETYRLISSAGENNGKLKGSVFYQDNELKTYPAVGDFVLIKANSQGEDIIYRVLDRYSAFSRSNPSLPTKISGASAQMVAANFDYVFVMTSLNYDFNPRRLERYLAAAWHSGGTPVIILTKSDLCSDWEEKAAITEGIAPGIDVHAISCHTGQGLEALERYLKPGKTLVFMGSSGIGKSSLVNCLAGEELMKVNTIREDDSKGHHTTTYRQLFALRNGALIIDTPGMRELGIWSADEGVSEVFSDIEELIASCRFHDCRHKTEPGCAVKKALAEGTLTASRYQSYLKLEREARFTAKKAALYEKRLLNSQKSGKRK